MLAAMPTLYPIAPRSAVAMAPGASLASPTMDWFWSPDYTVARFLLERGLAAIYLIAFANALVQFPALLGERGLEPAPRFLAVVSLRRAPSIFHWHFSDRALRAVALVGIVVSGGLLVGLSDVVPLPVTMLAWFGLWVLYLSIVNV